MTASTPARRYSWVPFVDGNTAAVKHGSRSERLLAPVMAEIAAELAARVPFATVAAFAPSFAALVRAEARVALLHDYVDVHGLLDDEGVPRPALAELERAERRADALRSQFGLSPSTWAALHRSAVADPGGGTDVLEGLKATGAAMIEATSAEVVGDE